MVRLLYGDNGRACPHATAVSFKLKRTIRMFIDEFMSA